MLISYFFARNDPYKLKQLYHATTDSFNKEKILKRIAELQAADILWEIFKADKNREISEILINYHNDNPQQLYNIYISIGFADLRSQIISKLMHYKSNQHLWRIFVKKPTKELERHLIKQKDLTLENINSLYQLSQLKETKRICVDILEKHKAVGVLLKLYNIRQDFMLEKSIVELYKDDPKKLEIFYVTSVDDRNKESIIKYLIDLKAFESILKIYNLGHTDIIEEIATRYDVNSPTLYLQLYKASNKDSFKQSAVKKLSALKAKKQLLEIVRYDKNKHAINWLIEFYKKKCRFVK